MIVQPKIRGFICTTAHPLGCAKNVQAQIDYVRSQKPIPGGPRKVLIVGASTGYGLSSRVVAAFGGSNAATIGVVFEREAEFKRTATAGWYNTVAFEQKAKDAGLYAKTVNGDAFASETKQKVRELIRQDWQGQVDLVIYSVAAPRRQHPQTGVVSKSVLKPIGASYTGKSIDLSTDKLETVTLPAASPDEINQTIAVMGGEDWQMWIDELEKNKMLAPGVSAVAYSYIGPQLTKAIYRSGTIGKAKNHLEKTAQDIDAQLKKLGGKALISVNRALITQSSSAIPFIPLYYIVLNKIMKEKNIDESCIQQMYRLFAGYLYGNQSSMDGNGFIRLDNLELREDVQRDVYAAWDKLQDSNLYSLTDLQAYHDDFLKLFGFGFPDINYDEDVDIDLKFPSA
jgi:enoyl-[acyl-carrier protein] reductase/trans-2-enoyl-CoA reductase (NAD+)